jgi:hypothetical protein
MADLLILERRDERGDRASEWAELHGGKTCGANQTTPMGSQRFSVSRPL